MPTSIDVRLPRKVKAKFPDRCVRCGANDPECRLSIWTTATGWWVLLTLFWGRPIRVVVPACWHCKWLLRIGRWGDSVLMLALALGVVFVFMPLIEPHVPRIVTKYLMVLLFLICLIPYFVWKVFWPPAFDITATGKSIEYEFRDSTYAFDFADLNEDELERMGI